MAPRKARAPRRHVADSPRATTDGWENLWTGLGTARDRRSGMVAIAPRVSPQEAEELYRGDDTAAKIVDDPAQEMVRKWIDLAVKTKDGKDDKGIAEAITDRLEELNAETAFFDALRWERAYGGSAIIPLIEDGSTDQAKPVNDGAIRNVIGLTVLDRTELWPATYYLDPASPKYGQVETYMITQWGAATVSRVGVRVHETRVIKFPGIQVSKRHATAEQEWGDPVFVRIMQVMADFGMVWGGAAHLLSDFSQAVFRIKGLRDAIEAGREDLIRARIEQIEIGRSMVRAALLDAGDGETGDSGEVFERKSTPLAGYPDMLDRFAQRLASAADMPLSRLFGLAGAGLGSDDKAGDTWWTQRISGLQKTKLKRPLERIVKLLLLAKEGPTKGKEPEKWSLTFRPLREVDPLQEAQRRAAIATADSAYVQAQVLLPEEVALSRFGGDRFGEEIVLDEELRKKMEEEQAAEAEALAQQGQQPPGAAPPPFGQKPKAAAKPGDGDDDGDAEAKKVGAKKADAATAEAVPVSVSSADPDEVAEAVVEAVAPVLERLGLGPDDVDVELQFDPEGRVVGALVKPLDKPPAQTT